MLTVVFKNDVNVPLDDAIQATGFSGGTYNVTASGLSNMTITFTITGGTLTLGTTDVVFGGGGNGSSSFTATGQAETVAFEDGALNMQRNSLEISTIGAKFDDFDFELPLRVTGFKFKVPGQPTIDVNGDKLDARAKQALSKAKRGSGVQIFDIEAKAQGVSVILKKVSPVFIELTN